MARYRKYDVRISLDDKVRRLTPMEPSGEGLWYYLLSMPETTMIPGLCRVGRASIAEARGWDLKGFGKAFGELFAEGLAKADWEARVLWIPNVIKYDPPTNPNVVLGWSTHWDEIPECPLKLEAWQRLNQFFIELTESNRLKTKGDSDPEAWLKAFMKACPKPSGKGSPNPLVKPRARTRIRNRKPDTGTGVEQKERGGSGAASGPLNPLPFDAQNGRKGKFDPSSVPLPPLLDTPDFREAWARRLKERGEPGASGGKPSESQIEAQLRKLEKLATVKGVPAAVAAVERAIEGRHQGIVFPNDFEEPRNGSERALTPDQRRRRMGAQPDWEEQMRKRQESVVPWCPPDVFEDRS